jgi:hypothetical protein
MQKHRSPRNRVSKQVPPHNTDDTDNPSIVSIPDTFNPAEALQKLHLEVVQLEALVNAANEAVVQLPFPSDREARRPFDRVYALVTKAADETNALVNLGGQMMDALTAHLQRKHADG